MSEKPTIHELEQILDEDDPGKVTIQPDGSVIVRSLEEEIRHVLNKHSAENASDTPDFVLANFLISCLASFNVAVEQRETWHQLQPDLPTDATSDSATPGKDSR